jgi:hypothetical protein
MSRINQPPAPVLPNAGRTIDVGMKTTVAPQPTAAQPQGRAAAAQDGFTAQAATPMVLNPQAQARATRPEVLPGAPTDSTKMPSNQQLRDMVLKAFHEQYGKNATATEAFINQWIGEAKKIFGKENSSQFLFEKVFSAMNKAAAAGQTSPLPGQDFTKLPSDQQLRDMVTKAFKEQYGKNATPTEAFINQWVGEAKKIFGKENTSQFLFEKVFSALNKAAAAGQTSPLPGQDFTKLPSDQQLRDMVTKAFKEQYGKNATATEAFINQWVGEAKKIFGKENSSQFLFEKVFSAMNKAAAAGQTSPLPETDFTKAVTPEQLKAAVEFAFKQQFNAAPTQNELTAWMAEAKKIAERDNTTQFLGEKVFAALNKAVSGG